MSFNFCLAKVLKHFQRHYLECLTVCQNGLGERAIGREKVTRVIKLESKNVYLI